MNSRRHGDAKAEAIYATAKKIIEADSARHRAKTDRLRALRLAKEAETEGLEKKTTKR